MKIILHTLFSKDTTTCIPDFSLFLTHFIKLQSFVYLHAKSGCRQVQGSTNYVDVKCL